MWTLAYSFIGLFVYLFITASAGAACQPVYGGGLTCQDTSFTIEKQVLNPTTQQYVHNLGLSSGVFHANDTVTFRITLTNNGTNPIQEIIVKDMLPDSLNFVNGPGSFDTTKHLLTFTVNDLSAHQSKQYTIKGQVESQERFPQNSFCSINSVSGLPSSGSIVQDSSQFCMQKLNSTPATGANPLELLSLLPTALAGFGIKQFSKKEFHIS